MNSVVLGLGFGDEGKGRVVDALCAGMIKQSYEDRLSDLDKPTVVRFSGGGQAGHTVVLEDGTKHVFSNLGSGTLRGCPTYWSEHCPFDPSALLNELTELGRGMPLLYVNGKCPVVTPYDIEAQRSCATNRTHGTVGCGIGTTIQREEDHHHLLVEDLAHPMVVQIKLNLIAQYYGAELDHSGFSDACLLAQECYQVIYDRPNTLEFIWEGSQGLLLDQNIGFFPHVTRSNTGSANIPESVRRTAKIYAVTRAYQTRHGAGPMTNEARKENSYIMEAKDETNQYGNYQGIFRRSLLDLDLLEYGMTKEPMLRLVRNRDVLVITCLDHMGTPAYTVGGVVKVCGSLGTMAETIRGKLGFNSVQFSMSPSGPLHES